MIFDLFDTLVPGGSRVERDAVSFAIARDLGVDPEAFANVMRDSFDDRARGRLGSVGDTVTTLARRLGAEPSASAVADAVERRLAMTRDLHARTWALPALGALRDAGARIGLVSDCSNETPEVWPDSPLAEFIEVTSFSCQTGFRKPAPEAYLAATDALGVRASDCLYVGDGGSSELTGAAALGMTAVRYGPEEGQSGDAIDLEGDWAGRRVADLTELCDLIS